MKPQHEASFLNIVPFLGGSSANGSGWQNFVSPVLPGGQPPLRKRGFIPFRRTGFVFQYGLLSGGLSGSDPEGDCFGPLPDPVGQRDHIDVVGSLLFAYENIRVRRNGLRKRLFRIEEEFAVACAGVGIEGNLQFVLLPF